MIKKCQNNKRYLLYEDQLIISKSKIEQENYDVLLFCLQNAEKVTIPESIEIIQSYSFSYCDKLKEVEFSENSKLRIIEKKAFYNSSIEKINLPASLTIIDDDPFYSCGKLNQVNIPKNSKLQSIGKNAFGCTSIECISIPSNLTELRFGWNEHLSKLRMIKVDPNNPIYSTIGEKLLVKESSPNKLNYDYLVLCLPNVKTVSIPSFIEIIGPYALQYIKVDQIEFPKDSKLRIIEDFAFNSASIQKISFPSNLETIKSEAFSGASIQSIEFPIDSKLQMLEDKLFSYRNLESIFIAPNIKSIGKETFDNCDNLKNIKFAHNSQLQTIEEKAFYASSIESFELPPQLLSIGFECFAECEQLRDFKITSNSKLRTINDHAFNNSPIEFISIPESLIELTENWCSNTPSLNKIQISPNNPRYSLYKDQLIIGKSKIEQNNYDVLLFCARNAKKVTIPNFIEIINSNLFSECKKIQKVEIPFDSKLQIIKEFAFFLTKIKEIFIPQNLLIYAFF